MMLVMSSVCADINLADNDEEVFTVKIDSNKMEEPVEFYVTETELAKMGEELPKLGKLEKIKYITNKLNLPFNFLMKIAGFYVKNV